MVAQMTRRQPRSAPLALLFTDARGRIVFVDNNFLDMLSASAATSLVGAPLHSVLGTDEIVLQALMKDVARTGYVHERLLSLKRADGSLRPVLCSSVATYNSEGEFIGVDITLHDAAEATEPHDVAPVHGDVLQSRIQQINTEAGAKAYEEQARVQMYFVVQMNALQVLLGRMGGPRIHAALEATFNKVASKRGWPIRIEVGQIAVMDGYEVPDEAYHTLLRGVIDYGRNIIGRAALVEEMRVVDAAIDAQARQLAERAGLRLLIQ